MRLEGKVAVITGGGSGIGKATAKLFAKEGAKVLVADYNPKLGEETVEEIKKAGGMAYFEEVDVGYIADNKRMIETAINLYQRLDILYNNAGHGGPSFEDTTEENWNRMLNVVLTGPFFACKYAIEQMRKQGSGNIIFTSSIFGMWGISKGGLPAYCTAKGGVIMLGDCLSRLLGKDNIRVNVICPGVTNTAIYDLYGSHVQTKEDKEAAMTEAAKGIALGKVGQPDDVASLALFLASDESSHLTGGAYVCDGGRT